MIFDRSFVILCLFNALTLTVCFDNSIPKCCPSNQTLSVSHLNAREIECIPSEYGPFYGPHLRNDEQVYEPPCLNWNSRRYSERGGLLTTNGCVDIVHGYLQGIQCPSEAHVEVVEFQKCCPDGHMYDLDERKCFATPNAFDAFKNFFSDNTVAVFKTGVPNCADDEVFVEYHTHIHDIWPEHSTLTISFDQREKDILAPNSFCIEGSWKGNSTANTSPEDAFNIIVRSCRPRKICGLIPCVQRCCKNDQMLERKPNKTRSECVDHPEQKNIVPSFHRVQHSLLTHEPEPVEQYGN